MTTDPHRVSVTPTEHTAPHTGPAFDHVLAAGRAVVALNGPHYLAHFSGSVYDIAVDVFDGVARLSSGTRRARAACRDTGRLLAAAVEDLDGLLGEARTGPLIRTVVHSDRGAFSCADIVPGRHVVGVVFDRATEGPLTAQHRVVTCDRAVSDLVTEQRRDLSLGSLYPGGYGAEQPEDDASAKGTGASKVHTERGWDAASLLPSELLAEVEPALSEVIAPRDVHYLALCVEGQTALGVDCLDHDDISRFFTQISVQERRSFYQRLSVELPMVVGRLTRISASVTGTRLLRLVLDVEQGAVYYYRLSRGAFLVGVTLNQAMVGDADEKIAEVALACGALPYFGT